MEEEKLIKINLKKLKEILKPNYKKITVVVVIQLFLIFYVASGAAHPGGVLYPLVGASSNPIIIPFQLIAVFLILTPIMLIFIYHGFHDLIFDYS